MKCDVTAARGAALLFLLVGAFSLSSGCGGEKNPAKNLAAPTPTVTTTFDAPQQDLNSVVYKPSFAPDYNHLTAQPWVEPVTNSERDAVDVYPDRLEFPDTLTDVGTWEPGRVVVSAPGQGSGKNAFGFARRVAKVQHVGGKYIVTTTTVPVEDLIQGDFLVRISPDNAVPVDLSKVTDPQWVIDTYYYNTPNVVVAPSDGLTSNAPEVKPLSLSWDDFTSGIGIAANAIKDGAMDAWVAITPATLGGTESWKKGFKLSQSGQLFPVDSSLNTLPLAQKTFYTKDGTGFKIKLDGSLSYGLTSVFKPGLQFGVKLAVPGHHEKSSYTLSLDSYLRNAIMLDADFNVTFASAPHKISGTIDPNLAKKLKVASALSQSVLSVAKTELLGDNDFMPAGGWKWILWQSEPYAVTLMAGPVPVVVTATFQLDLECGFEARAGIQAAATWDNTTTFKVAVTKTAGEAATVTPPKFNSKSNHYLEITGGGELSASCSLIPRANVLLYDTGGMFAGIRGSLIGEATFKSECKDTRKTQVGSLPDATATIGLYSQLGLQVGGMVQVPGASAAGAEGDVVAKDLAMVEPWTSPKYKLAEKVWNLPGGGLGYCAPTCPDGKKDGDETDVDCGGSCSTCALGQKCKLNSDCEGSVCSGGVCAASRCDDGVRDGLETDIDCGGGDPSCLRCGVGKQCKVGADCASGFCSAWASGTDFGVCKANHCHDGVKDGDEGGVDCGGALCPKCGVGVAATSKDDCASGAFNGSICVANTCEDLQKDDGETDVDCGGAVCVARCGAGMGCMYNHDCSSAAPVCGLVGPTGDKKKECLKPDGARACHIYPDGSNDCASGVCTAKTFTCAAPTCSDGVKNGRESDVDCGLPCPTKCADGQSCSAYYDCQSRRCVSGKCVPASCSDNVVDGTETGVDCGGPICQKCITGSCLSNTDCLLGNCLGAGQPGATCYPPAGLLAAFPFDQNSNDIANPPSLAHNATLVGTYAYVTNAHSGSHSLMLTSAWGDLGTLDLGDKFTIATWLFIPTGSQISANTLLANAMPGTSADGFKFFFNSMGTTDLSLHLETGDGVTGCEYATAPSTLELNVWQHVAVTVDRAAGVAAFYVNGNPVAGSGCVVPGFGTNLPLYISKFVGGEYAMKGNLDDLRLYTVVLSPADVKVLSTY